MTVKQHLTSDTPSRIATATTSIAASVRSTASDLEAAYRKSMRRVAMLFVALNIYTGGAFAQTFCSEEGVGVLTGVLNTLFGLGYSIGGIGLAITFFGATTVQAFSFLSQEQEETVKRARKKGISSFGMLFVGGIILKVVFSSLNILDCVTILPFS